MSSGWHVGRWGALGWVETAVKVVAMFVAAIGLAGRDGADGGGWGRTLAVSALTTATIGLVAAIADRTIEREIVAMVFVVFNVAAHVAIVLVATGLPAARGTVVTFCTLMIIGDAVKIVFLHREHFQVRAVGTKALLGLTSAYLVLSALAIVGAVAA